MSCPICGRDHGQQTLSERLSAELQQVRAYNAELQHEVTQLKQQLHELKVDYHKAKKVAYDAMVRAKEIIPL